MNEENKNCVDDTDSLKEIIEFQNNMFNPGYYVGTGKVPPTVKATGNALPLAVMYFIGAIMWLSLALSQILCKRRNAVKTEINILPAAAVNPLSPY